MARISKKRKAVEANLDLNKIYTLEEASSMMKDINCTSFDSSVDIHVRLNIDPRKADHALRGTINLPHGTGKTKTVLVLCTPDKEEEAKAAGADYVGLDEYISKIESGWTDVDVIVATPAVMPKIGRLGRVLGPRNLMPNPKTGTVTNEVANAVSDVKGGKISFRVDKAGIVHASVGRVSFEPNHIKENAAEVVNTLLRMKPASARGVYMKSIYLASTMSPGLQVDTKSI